MKEQEATTWSLTHPVPSTPHSLGHSCNHSYISESHVQCLKQHSLSLCRTILPASSRSSPTAPSLILPTVWIQPPRQTATVPPRPLGPVRGPARPEPQGSRAYERMVGTRNMNPGGPTARRAESRRNSMNLGTRTKTMMRKTRRERTKMRKMNRKDHFQRSGLR